MPWPLNATSGLHVTQCFQLGLCKRILGGDVTGVWDPGIGMGFCFRIALSLMDPQIVLSP